MPFNKKKILEITGSIIFSFFSFSLLVVLLYGVFFYKNEVKEKKEDDVLEIFEESEETKEEKAIIDNKVINILVLVFSILLSSYLFFKFVLCNCNVKKSDAQNVTVGEFYEKVHPLWRFLFTNKIHLLLLEKNIFFEKNSIDQEKFLGLFEGGKIEQKQFKDKHFFKINNSDFIVTEMKSEFTAFFFSGLIYYFFFFFINFVLTFILSLIVENNLSFYEKFKKVLNNSLKLDFFNSFEKRIFLIFFGFLIIILEFEFFGTNHHFISIPVFLDDKDDAKFNTFKNVNLNSFLPAKENYKLFKAIDKEKLFQAKK